MAALLVATIAASSFAASAKPYTITSGNLAVSFTPEEGMTSVSLDGKPIWSGSSASVTGQWMTLVRDVPTQKSDPTPVKNSDVPIPIIWGLVKEINSAQPHTPEVVAATTDRYTVRHTYADGLAITFDHEVKGPDITCRITVDNDGRDYFQLNTWMAGSKFEFSGKTEQFQGTWGFYPGATTYSPVVCLWDDKAGVGVNWIEHRLRPISIEVNKEDTPDRAVSFKLCDYKGHGHYTPVEAGGRTRYAVTYRIDSTPKDWKNLLTPYKTWFNSYFGPCKYNMDFRVKLLQMPSNASLCSPTNPYGTRGKIDSEGWGTYIKERMEGIRKYPGVASHVIFWSILADPRGMNYRPDFNVIPPITRETMPLLRQFCRENNMGFGWFARPNEIAFKETWTQDSGAGWNMLDAWSIRMADLRYKDVLSWGCTAFYMDTYGGHVGISPNDGEANVMFLKHLRETTGPDCFTFIEHGSDAQHVYAAIWPWGGDKLGKAPLGDYARWLTPGTVEICRVTNLEGAKRAWEGGAVPAGIDLSDELVALQKQYVNADWTSRVRPDCKPAKSPVPAAEESFAKDAAQAKTKE